jgi:hypothetical protein
MAFPIGLGLAGIWDGATVLGALAVVFGLAIVAYNGSTRLRLGEEISFSRYGRTLWSVRSGGVKVRSDRCGDLRIVPAFTLTDLAGASGSFPKAMLSEDDVERFRRWVVNLGGQWLV